MSYEFVCVPESQCKDNTWGGRNVRICLFLSVNVLKCLDKGENDRYLFV